MMAMNQPKEVSPMSLSDARMDAALPASDIARAKAFYAEKLGLNPTMESEMGAMYDCGSGTRFMLFPSAGTPSGTHTQAGFSVADLEAEVAMLKSRGLVFDEYDMPGLKTEGGIATDGSTKSAFFHDSEGNLIGLIEWPSE
jgi:catechol 2,3-dioxygenase-like lactoylglutathione lyase family enzyme